MKVEEIYPEKIVITQEMKVVEDDGRDQWYTRHDAENWTYFVSYDLIGEEYCVDDEKAKQLETLFQEYKELI